MIPWNRDLFDTTFSPAELSSCDRNEHQAVFVAAMAAIGIVFPNDILVSTNRLKITVPSFISQKPGDRGFEDAARMPRKQSTWLISKRIFCPRPPVYRVQATRPFACGMSHVRFESRRQQSQPSLYPRTLGSHYCGNSFCWSGHFRRGSDDAGRRQGQIQSGSRHPNSGCRGRTDEPGIASRAKNCAQNCAT